MMHYQYESKV